MRQALQDTQRFVQKSNIVSLPAPVGGWNASDGLASMPTLDAVVMDNFVPSLDGIVLRSGDTLFATGLPGEVETLAESVTPTGSTFMAASEANVYNITSGTPVSVGGPFTSSQWQTQQFRGNLFFVNGVDTPQTWNGTTLAASGWTGPTVTDLINISLVRDRLWFCLKDSTTAYYTSTTGAITGALTNFDLFEFVRNGFLVQIASWSRDSGSGMDDFTVFIVSEGEALVYSGDPASTFSLGGRYKMPKPIGRRCTINIGGELVVLTEGGYLTMTSIMAGNYRTIDSLSGKIRNAVIDASSNKSQFGWSMELTASQEALVVNVPVSNTIYQQHVYNTVANEGMGGWGRWKDRNMITIARYNDTLYGGTVTGEVYDLDTGDTDASRAGADIAGNVTQAFNGLEGPELANVGTRNKRITALRPYVAGTGTLQLTCSAFADFKLKTLTPNLQEIRPETLLWQEINMVTWDSWLVPWGSEETGVSSKTLGANVFGRTFGISIAVETNQQIRWYATDITAEVGGII